MFPLTPPKDSAKTVFTVCISKVKDRGLKRRLKNATSAINKSATGYRTAGRMATLYTLLPHDKVGTVKRDEMIAVYTDRMVKKGAPGRLYYDKLMVSPAQGRCPLCGQRTVSTLDHHLPKTEFPSLVVNPYNLIPSCGDCNKVKLNALATHADEQTLHPYFDNIDSKVWLKSLIIEMKPAAATFSVDTTVLPANMAKRVEHHFTTFRLGVLYASHAADELVAIRHRLAEILKAGNPAAVKRHLQAEATSRAKVKKNSWQAALYAALASNDWYCKGGCKAK